MIGTDENRAALHVEVIFWSGKRKIPPSLVSGKYCPHFGHRNYRIFGCMLSGRNRVYI